jgi:ABC-type multidrug transport system fused ATPase/permease subunit
VNHDSSVAKVAYLSRIFSVNDDSSPAPGPAAARPADRAHRAPRPGLSPDPDGLLEVHGVTVRFGGLTALDAVSFTAPGRQVTGVIGPNGAGKTTLLNVLCGFVRPDGGRLSSVALSWAGSARIGWPRWASPGRCRAWACSAT